MRRSRRAFSLLEVILAMAVLLGSTLILTQLLGIGREHAIRAEDASQAQMLCQRKLAEILSGVAPAEPVDDEHFPESPDWTVTVEVEPVEGSPLLSIAVTVAKQSPPNGRDRRADANPRSFRLVRWVRPPASGDMVDHMDGSENQGSARNMFSQSGQRVARP